MGTADLCTFNLRNMPGNVKYYKPVKEPVKCELINKVAGPPIIPGKDC